MGMKKRMKSLRGKTVVIIPKKGDGFLVEVKYVKGNKVIFDVIGVGTEGGLGKMPINEIDDVNSI